jgi:phenylalanyl-tRNA synthetase beta chain
VRPLPFTSGRGPVNGTANLVRVQNPLADDEPFLRSTLLDTLAMRAEYNLNRMQGNVRLFEVGSVFVARPGSTPLEEVHAALLVMGQRRPSHFTEPQPPAFDAWDAKSLAQTLAEAAFPGIAARVEAGDEHALWYIMAGAARIGRVIRVPLDAPVWASPAFGVELTLGEMPNAAVAPKGQHAHGEGARIDVVLPEVETPTGPRGPVRFVPIPTFPAAEFDLALLVPETLPAGDVERVLRSAGGELLERCVLFDEFRGAGVPEGTRSLAWRLTFRHPERTLRDKELEGRRAQLIKSLEGALGVRPRTG